MRSGSTRPVRQMQESLRGARLDEADRDRIVEQLETRVRRLRGFSGVYGAVKLSDHVSELLPSALMA